ncbi:MAG: hypothetical protein ACKOQ6_04030 [Bacteroidota bacterium]
MKKSIQIIFFFFALAVFFASCKAHERCPAYGQMNKPKTHRIIIG